MQGVTKIEGMGVVKVLGAKQEASMDYEVGTFEKEVVFRLVSAALTKQIQEVVQRGEYVVLRIEVETNDSKGDGLARE